MMLAAMTLLDAPASPQTTFTITRYLAALTLLNSHARAGHWDDAVRHDFLATVRNMISSDDARHWAQLLDTGAMPEPCSHQWPAWYQDATAELHQAYGKIPAYRTAPIPKGTLA